MGMSKQLTVRLPEELEAALSERARDTGQRPSDIVRQALVEHLALAACSGRPIERVRRLIGSLESGQADLGERHREQVLKALRRAR